MWLDIDCLCPGGNGSDWKIPKSNVGSAACLGDVDSGVEVIIDGGKGNTGNVSMPPSPVALSSGLFLTLEERLVGALDPESESPLDVFEPVVLDPTLDAVSRLFLEARAPASIAFAIWSPSC